MADHRKRNARTPSRLIADLEERLGTQDLSEWIEVQAEQLGVLASTSDRGPISLGRDIFRARNVRWIIDDATIERARIVAREGAFEIRLNPALPMIAQRFAVAHELGHTFWFSSRHDTAALSPYQWVGARDPEIEMLCDRFAAALLLPRQRLLRWMRAYGIASDDDSPRFELLRPAARAFNVAEQAVARRLYVDLRACPLAIVWTRRVSRPALFGSGMVDVHWETSWCAVPEFVRAAALGREQTIALKTRRRIPDPMLPAITGRKTIEANLDRRWLTGVTPQPKGAARKKLEVWESSPSCDGYAWRGGEAAVIGVPVAAV